MTRDDPPHVALLPHCLRPPARECCLALINSFSLPSIERSLTLNFSTIPHARALKPPALSKTGSDCRWWRLARYRQPEPDLSQDLARTFGFCAQPQRLGKNSAARESAVNSEHRGRLRDPRILIVKIRAGRAPAARPARFQLIHAACSSARMYSMTASLQPSMCIHLP